ncbi:Arm DNA-binding domain-containing protein, partial [Paramagnetospirillum caucaseum]|uniref:Arm DNA-binding domain-containing protein n=1 Tax=Paramagnetospirillum caucaseum TaxID=1244869 RepID=UPI001F4379BD
MGAATKAKLSQSYAERIKPGASDEFHWDTTLPGFGLKVTTSGRSTWVFQRQVVGGKKPRLTLGSFPSMDFNHARQAAMAMTCQIESGENPKTIRTIEQKQAFTVEDVMEVYAKKEMKEVTRRNLRLF